MWGYFTQWTNGLHKRILCSTWTPQGKSMSTCTVQGNRKENNRTTKAGLPTNLIRKVVCGCVPSFIRYLMETENKTEKGKQNISIGKF